MKRVMLRVMLLTSIVSSGLLKALGELRSPLYFNKPIRYSLSPVDNAEGLWTFNTYKGAYQRSANSAWGKNHGRTKDDLSTLVFGKSNFKGEEAFPNAVAFGQGPAVSFMNIKPRFDYNEKGIFCGVEFERRFDDSKWRIGGSLGIPFKIVEVKQASACSSNVTDSNYNDEDLAGTISEETVLIDGDAAASSSANIRSRVYRLDYVSSLAREDGTPLVAYTDGVGANNGISIAGSSLEPAGITDATSVYVTKSPEHTLQSATQVDTDETLGNFVLGNGSFPNDQTINAVFQDNIDYRALGADRQAQKKLYIHGVILREVPPLVATTDENVRTTAAWNNIDNEIQKAINRLEQTGASRPEDYFKRNGVIFCDNEYIAGQGDLDLDFYVARDLTKKIWVKSTFGARLPTGRKRKDTGRVLFMPTGNNGHFELKTMSEFGVKPMRWMAMKADVSFHYVFEATERRAAAFEGATVKNLGQELDAKIKWNYLTAHFNISMFHPHNQDLGCTFGYEAYVKDKDKVEFKDAKARTFGTAAGIDTGAGTTLADLDSSILEKNTRRISHKICSEFFYRSNYGEIFAGASKVVAGKNIMRESEVHLGFGVHW